MARARRVPGIHAKRSLQENAVRVIDTRLEEFLSWRTALSNGGASAALHDLRIAAKRLRYALEMFEVCFPGARTLAKEVTQVQEDLGNIHDLDVLADLLRARLRIIDDASLDRAVEIAISSGTQSEHSNGLRQLMTDQAHDERRLGLLSLLGDQIRERRERYEAFRERWSGDQLDRFAARVRQAIEPGPTRSAGKDPGPEPELGHGAADPHD